MGHSGLGWGFWTPDLLARAAPATNQRSPFIYNWIEITWWFPEHSNKNMFSYCEHSATEPPYNLEAMYRSCIVLLMQLILAKVIDSTHLKWQHQTIRRCYTELIGCQWFICPDWFVHVYSSKFIIYLEVINILLCVSWLVRWLQMN